MKSLHVIDHFGLGGAQRIVEGILGVKPEAYLLPLHQKGGDLTQTPAPAERYLLKPSRNLFVQFLNLLKAPAHIRRQQIQVVHFHLHFSWLFGLWIWFRLGSRTAPRLIFHEHDSIRITDWYYPLFVRLMSRFGCFVAVSSFIQNRLIACGVPQQKIHLLRNFVDTGRFYPQERGTAPAFGLETGRLQNRRRVGFAGRLVAYKGWRVVLQLAARLPGCCFMVAGDGPDAGKMAQEIRRQGLQDRVFLLHYVPCMEDFYRQVDLLIIPSVRESFGLVQLEAQACGVPVVVFDSEAALEIHGSHSSVLVRSGDVDMLAQKVQEVLDDPVLYRALVKNGLVNAGLYDLQNYSRRLDQIYQDILEPMGEYA